MNLPAPTDKQLLRKQIAALYKAHDKQELACLSEKVTAKIEQCRWFAEARKIACFHSLSDEVNTLAFIEKWANVKEIYLPVILDDCRMELRRFMSGSKLSFNRYNIAEPLPGNCCGSEEVDLFLIPGVAFDRSLHRLGRGKGYYDRLLQNTAAKKVGLCFDFQLFDTVPSDAHDIAMDALFTPSEMLFASNSK